MNSSEFSELVEANKRQINSIVSKIAFRNSDYLLEEIKGMVNTAIWEKQKFNSKAIYMTVLNRILTEKGFIYKNGELHKPIISMSYDPEPEDYYDRINKSDLGFLVEEVFKKAKLTQVEVFVIALSNGLSTPSSLKGEFKKKLDNIEEEYYIRSLTRREIAGIMGMSVPDMAKIKKRADNKLKAIEHEIRSVYRSGQH